MTVVAKCVKRTEDNNIRIQLWYVTLESGDTEISIATGFKRILHHEISPPSVTAKYVTAEAVSDGTITYTVTNPETDEYFYIMVMSDQGGI